MLGEVDTAPADRPRTEVREYVSMDLKPGMRLRSGACDTEIIVIRAADDAVELTCGGAPMSAEPATERAPLAPGLDTGTLLGKRYTTGDADELEILVIKAGRGTLASGATPLAVMEARVLPSSD